jgi:hypothetical protein
VIPTVTPEILQPVTLQQLPYTLFSIHYSRIILLFEAIHAEMLTAPLTKEYMNKQQMKKKFHEFHLDLIITTTCNIDH